MAAFIAMPFRISVEWIIIPMARQSIEIVCLSFVAAFIYTDRMYEGIMCISMYRGVFYDIIIA